MKPKTSLIATAATIALFGAASGQTVIDITGSTAGRSAVIGRVKALLAGESAAWRGNASETSASRQIYYGGTFNGQPVTVRMFWSGSAAGVRDVSNAPQLAGSYIVSSYAGPTGQNESAALAPASAETASEIGFSDVFQSSTAFTTNTLADEVSVAVIPFLFMKNDGAHASLTNVTPTQFQYLFGSRGNAPLSLFTGDASHASHTVYATGRNNESGTRITTVANCYYGLNLALSQNQAVDVNADPVTLTNVGDGGYSSGGDVAKVLKATITGAKSIIGYVGTADGATAEAGGATKLKFNGVDYSEQAVYNGQYTLWGYLHQSTMLDKDAVGDVAVDFHNALKQAMIDNPGSGTLGIGLMQVERAADGSAVTPL